MESRIQRIFLIGALLIMATAVSFKVNADETNAADDDDELGKKLKILFV
jgi:hypothetical protein